MACLLLSPETNQIQPADRGLHKKVRNFISPIEVDSFIRTRRKLMKPSETELEKPSFWQLVFAQSKVNGALYLGERLPGHSWDWPKNTYFQRRLRQLRWYQASEKIRLN
jgi:hypothetical protein